ncbi:MAG: hypothetical protein VB034_00715 [Eubacteriales bacterium]|nr:hypothetical protein [Eubacteriales bacterium]
MLKPNPDIEIVVFAKGAVRKGMQERICVIGAVVDDRVMDDARKLVGEWKSFIFGYLPEMVLQLFKDLRFMCFAHLPQLKGNVMARVGIGDIEHIPQRRLLPAIVYDRDTLCALVYPTLEHIVPKLNGRASGSVRALCVDKHLFVKRVLVEPCGRVEKACPVLFGLCKLLRCLRRKL